jgi:hypothetical protein
MPRITGDRSVAPVAQPTTSPAKPAETAATTPAAGWQPKNLADPELAKKQRAEAHWAPSTGELFTNGVSSDDPVQGVLGDCYLVSGLASLAAVQPDVIKNAVKANADGTFTVTFHKDSFFGLFGKSQKPITVTVDGDMPTKNGKTSIYTRGRDTKELWPMIIEKAYAQLDGGYQTVNKGGAPTTIWQALTGKSGAMTMNVTEGTTRLWDKISNALAEKRPVAASTAPTFKDYEGTGLVKGHVYSVLGVEEKDGERFVKMRNPWGYKEPGADGKDDGLFTLPLETFKKQFAFTFFGG